MLTIIKTAIAGQHATGHHNNIHTVMLYTRLIGRVRNFHLRWSCNYVRFLGLSAVARSTDIVGNKMIAPSSFVSTETHLSLDPRPRGGDIARR